METQMRIPTLLSLKETSEKKGLSYDYLRRACLRGEIAHIRCGAKYMIDIDKLVMKILADEESSQYVTEE